MWARKREREHERISTLLRNPPTIERWEERHERNEPKANTHDSACVFAAQWRELGHEPIGRPKPGSDHEMQGKGDCFTHYLSMN